MKKSNAIDELFPGLNALLETCTDPLKWEYKNSRLFNNETQEYLYESSATSDFEYEKTTVKSWLENIECYQSADMPTSFQVVSEQADKFRESGFANLDDINLRNIHDTANDLQTQWACLQLKNFIAKQKITLNTTTKNYTDGLLIVYGLGELSIIGNIITKIKPRIAIIFEPDVDLIATKVTNDECEKILTELENHNCKIFLVTDSEAEKCYLKSKVLIEMVNLFSQECLYTINFRENEFFKEIDSKYKSGDSMLKDISLLGFFVDEIHMIMNSSITFTQMPPKIIKYKSYQPREVHAVITASGPSLEKNLPLLSESREKYHLFCCYSTLGALAKNNIIPDYHCNQERHCLHLPMLDDTRVAEIAKQIILICSANNDPRMNSIYRDALAIFRSGSTASALFAENKSDRISGEGNQVANLALISAILLGYRTIHLFGVDLGATSKDDGRSSNALVYNRKTPRVFTKKRPGNLGNEVWVDNGLIDSAMYMSNQLLGTTLPDQQLIEGLTVYNYGEGQKIEGAVPSRPENFRENIGNSNSKVSSSAIVDSLIRYDIQIARARYIAFDWRNRIKDYLSFVRKCIKDPFTPCAQEQFFSRSEREMNELSQQVMSRLMSGSLARTWFFMIKLNNFMPELSADEQKAWEDKCLNILEACLESMERITLETLDHVEELESLDNHDFVSLNYNPRI